MLLRRTQFLLALAGLAGLALVSTGKPEPRRPHAPLRVRTGIDVLAARDFTLLRGKRVGLITNQTGRSAEGRRTIDILAAAAEVTLTAVFAPEHGLEGELSGRVDDTVDNQTRLRVHSLYGQTRRPTPEMLRGLDALVFDLQDAGVRYYTFITTMGYAMEAAAEHGLEFIVLDRPNPLNGVAVQGPALDADRLNFEGYFSLPLRHGLTVGELARLFNGEKKIGARLRVVRLENWSRAMWFDATGLAWVNPSPNLRSLPGNTFYPAVELLRAGDISVGRGTETPFELFGAPWIDAAELARYLEARKIPGVRFTPTEFTPTSDVHAGHACHGVRLIVTDRESLDVGRLGVELLSALWRLYPREFQLEKTIRLLGSQKTLARIRAGDDPAAIVNSWQEELEAFRELRAPYLL
ncbi:MAG: exo-beta-N-acetylmuramidase NamZ domain-containing protein, partial [Terriglobia bacterium]